MIFYIAMFFLLKTFFDWFTFLVDVLNDLVLLFCYFLSIYHRETLFLFCFWLSSLFFKRTAGLWETLWLLAILLKKRLWHRSFPVNFTKFLTTHSLQNTSRWQLLHDESRWLQDSMCASFKKRVQIILGQSTTMKNIVEHKTHTRKFVYASSEIFFVNGLRTHTRRAIHYNSKLV